MASRVNALLSLLFLLTRPCLPASAVAQAEKLGPGDHARRVTVAGRARSYHVHVPRSYDGSKPFPVVLAFHGGGGNAKQMERYSGLSQKADKAGFIAVYPNGTGRFERFLLTWNTGIPAIYATRMKVDDVGFTRALLDDIETCLNVDRRRVYATGISNGAMMAFLLAEQLSDRIAAIAPVAVTMRGPTLPLGRPVPVVYFHGTQDMHAPFEGGIGKHSRVGFKFPALADTVAAWVKANGCPEKPTVTELPDSADDGMRVTREAYGPSAQGAEVVLYRIEGGGHTWPGAARSLGGMLGPTTRDISANDIMWDFFQRHPMR